MILLLTVALWIWHGVILLWNWGQFRPRIALLHGIGVALLAGLLIWLQVPAWMLYAGGALVGGVAGWGHRLAPGLWVGVGLLFALPWLIGTAHSLVAMAVFALTAQAVAGQVSFARSSW